MRGAGRGCRTASATPRCESVEAPFVWHMEVVVLMEIQPGLTASGFQHARDTLDNLPHNPPTSTSPIRQCHF